jgi:uncharacterized protein (TIGR03435 family)
MTLPLVFHTLNARKGAYLLAAVLISFAAPTASPQTSALPAPGQPPAWDVISVKPVKPADGTISHTTTVSNGYSVTQPLRQFIAEAYGIRQELISGLPGWADSTPFAIEAKVAPSDIAEYHGLPKRQKELMLQSILEDRFKLKAHTDTRQLPVYELVPGKHVVLHEAQQGEGGSSMGPGQITCKNCSVSVLAEMLSQTVQRDVLDHTGLTRLYDIKLRWSDSAGPSLFTALEEQLGLKLESSKGAVKTLVVEHAEQPSEN